MAAPAPGTVVVFLASDPELSERRAAQPAPVSQFYRTFLPTQMIPAFRKSPSGEGTDRAPAFPPGQVMCALRVLDAAKKTGHKVRVVDVNVPGDDRPMVDRFVGPSDLLPILLRCDGQCLEGEESFSPRALRQFLAHG